MGFVLCDVCGNYYIDCDYFIFVGGWVNFFDFVIINGVFIWICW